MREPPSDLSGDILLATLRAEYGLAFTDLTFLPLGHDASAWVYRVDAINAAPSFLKVRRDAVNESGVLIPHYLHQQGIAQVVAPIPTVTQALWTEVMGYALILYPFVGGITGMDLRMDPSQWTDYGAILRRIHSTTLPADLTRIMRRETFSPHGAETIRDLHAHIDMQKFTDREARRLATFWQQRRDEIDMLVDRAEQLGRRLAHRGPASVLCHADIHTANVLLDADGRIWIVDWDETMLAPRERDLMFVLGGGISRKLVRAGDEELFMRGYGTGPIDPLALAYYRYAWAVSDIAAFGEQVFLRPDLGPVSRNEALNLFISLFQPGEIVAIARASASRLHSSSWRGDG